MDLLDQFGPRDGQQIIGPEERIRMIRVDVTPKIFLGQPIALDHGAHGTVQNEDSPR